MAFEQRSKYAASASAHFGYRNPTCHRFESCLGRQRKADRKSGLFFLSLLCRIYGNTAPRSGRGKCTCALMSERSERIVGFKHKVFLMFRREQAPPYGKRCRLRSKVMSKQSERVVRIKTGRRSRQKSEAIALGLLRWCISYYFLSFYIRSE